MRARRPPVGAATTNRSRTRVRPSSCTIARNVSRRTTAVETSMVAPERVATTPIATAANPTPISIQRVLFFMSVYSRVLSTSMRSMRSSRRCTIHPLTTAAAAVRTADQRNVDVLMISGMRYVSVCNPVDTAAANA